MCPSYSVELQGVPFLVAWLLLDDGDALPGGAGHAVATITVYLADLAV
jgi:hypothetical protein